MDHRYLITSVNHRPESVTYSFQPFLGPAPSSSFAVLLLDVYALLVRPAELNFVSKWIS